MKERLREAVAQVLVLLAQKKYEDLARLTNEKRLNAQELAKAVSDYGRTLVQPPEDAFRLLDVVQISGAQPPRWSITMPVWTQEEGRSDLSIELTITECGNGFSIELDDLHVL